MFFGTPSRNLFFTVSEPKKKPRVENLWKFEAGQLRQRRSKKHIFLKAARGKNSRETHFTKKNAKRVEPWKCWFRIVFYSRFCYVACRQFEGKRGDGMREAAAKTHWKRIGQSHENYEKMPKIKKKTMEKQRTQTKQAADTEFHRFFSILGSPGGGKIDEFSKKSLLKCMRFFACEKKRKKSR